MKAGDKVRVKSVPFNDNDYVHEMIHTIGNIYEIKEINDNPVSPIGLKVPKAEGEHDLWWYDEKDLEPVKSKSAKILTEKIMVNEVKWRKILGFENVLDITELPKKYLNDKPAFHKTYRNEVLLRVPDSVTLIIRIGELVEEKMFQEMVKWMKCASSRLTKINKQEHDAWSGTEMVEI